MATKDLEEEIAFGLQMFQISMGDEFFVPEKAAEICVRHYQRCVDDFVNDLIAYRLNCVVDPTQPLTQEFLNNFERSRSNQEATNARRKCQYGGQTPTARKPSNCRSFSTSRKSQQVPAAIFLDYGITECEDDAKNEEFVNEYDDDGCMDVTQDQKICQTPKSLVTVESFSPACVTPSHLFIERLNVGNVEVNYGDVHKTDWMAGKRISESGSGLVQRCELVPVLDKAYQFMNQTVRSVQEALNDRVDYVMEQIWKMHPEIKEITSNSVSQQEHSTYICGALFNGDDSERPTRLISDKVCLRSSKAAGGYATVDLSALSEYSLFPGEVVCFGGKVMDSGKFMAEKLFAGVLPPLAVLDSLSFSGAAPERLSVVIASGPFTPSDGFGYEPLVALLNYVQKRHPHVLLLTGPIVPANREDILDLPMSCQEFFEHIVSKIVDTCESCGTQVIVVASAEDATLCPCYPTPPVKLNRSFDKNKMQPMFASDPCLLRIGGILFGITATDVLFHLSSEEMKVATADSCGDRMSQLTRHLLLQQTFYPLFPPPLDISIDLEHSNIYAKLPVSPHVLILPSVLKCFLKDVGNVLAVNPGRLTKGRGGGTFCRLEFDRSKLAHENGDVMRCLRGQVVRI